MTAHCRVNSKQFNTHTWWLRTKLESDNVLSARVRTAWLCPYGPAHLSQGQYPALRHKLRIQLIISLSMLCKYGNSFQHRNEKAKAGIQQKNKLRSLLLRINKFGLMKQNTPRGASQRQPGHLLCGVGTQTTCDCSSLKVMQVYVQVPTSNAECKAALTSFTGLHPAKSLH